MIRRRSWAKISGERARARRSVARDPPRPAAVRARNERTTRASRAHDTPRDTSRHTTYDPPLARRQRQPLHDNPVISISVVHRRIDIT